MGLAVKAVNSRMRGPIKDTHTRKREIPSLSKEYQAVFENTGKAMVVVEDDAIISLANAEFEKLSGYTKEEIEGKKSWTEFVVRDDRKRVKEYHLLRRTDPILAPRCFEFRFLDRQEKVKNIILTIGQIPGTSKSMASLQDVTDRRKAEESEQKDKKAIADFEHQTTELARANEELQAEIADLKREVKQLQEDKKLHRSLVENVDFGINLIDADYTIVMANAEQSKRLNKPLSEIIGKKCYQEFEKRDAVCPHCPGVQTLANGQPAEVETEAVRDDGSRFNVRIQTFPVLGDDGTVTSFTEVVENITERKQIKESLRETEEHYRILVDNIRFGINLIDTDHTIMMVNAAQEKYFKKPRAQFVGKKCFHEFEKRDAICPHCPAVRAMATKKPAEVETVLTADDGSHFHVRIQAFPIFGKDGAVTSFIEIAENITERKQAEELLQQEKETFYTILQNALYGVALMASDGKHVFVNPEFTAITGYTLEDIPTGEDWMNKAYPDKAYRQEVTELWRKDSTLGGTRRVVSIVCKDGVTKEIETSRTPLENGLSVVMLADITERKQMEEALRVSEQHHRSLFEESLDGICLADAETGIIIDCNKAMADMVSRERADLIGKPQTILHPSQDDQENFSPTFKQHLTDKEGQIIETQVITKTGDIREVEIKANSMNFQGRKLLQGVFRDITERKQMEEELKASRMRLEDAMDMASIVYWESDPKAEQFIFNDAFYALYGTTAEAEGGYRIAIQDYFQRFLHPDDFPLVKKWVEEGEQCPDPVSTNQMEHRIIRRDGEVRYVIVRNRIMKDSSGNTITVVGTNQDITERKRMEEALRESEERFKMLAEHAPLGISIMAPDRSFEYLNPRFMEIFGYTLDDIPDKDTWFKKAYPDKAYRKKLISTWKQDTAEGVKTGKENPRVFTVRCKNGQDKIIDFRRIDLKEGKQYQIYDDITNRIKAEEGLKQSEERYRTLVENVNLGINLIDANHNIIMVNTGQGKHFNKAGSETIGKKCYQEFEKRDAVCPHCPGVQTLATGQPAEAETEGIRDDGSRFKARLQTFPIFGQDGAVTSFIEVVENITERKQMEEALRESEERFRRLIETTKVGVSAIDEKGVIIYANERLSEMWGCPMSEIIRHSSHDFLDEENLKILKEQLAKRKKGEHESYEITWTRKDGSKVSTILSPTPIFDADGRVKGSYGFITDITERKQMEEALRQSEERFRKLVETMKVGLSGVDNKFVSTYANDQLCKMWGYSMDEIIGRPVTDFLDEENRNILHDLLAQRKKGVRDDSPYELTWTRKDGQKVHTIMSPTPYFDVCGHHKSSFAIITDITERKRMEERLKRYAAELEQTNEEVKNFAYIVSHDLRVPLVNLKGYTSELCSALEVIGPAIETTLPHLNEDKRLAVAMALHEDVPEALEFISNSVSRMDSFINSVLILSRLGRRELKPEPIDMNALVQMSLENLSYQIQERGTMVTVGSLPQVVADRTAMEQIMGNILGNAVKYLDPDRPGQIEVTAENNNGEQIFHIRDNGRGIAEEDMNKVFAPFRRAGKQDTQGEGMGLAYVQTLVRRQDGRIWCKSELGKGTTFTFTIAQHRTERGNHVAH